MNSAHSRELTVTFRNTMFNKKIIFTVWSSRPYVIWCVDWLVNASIQHFTLSALYCIKNQSIKMNNHPIHSLRSNCTFNVSLVVAFGRDHSRCFLNLLQYVQYFQVKPHSCSRTLRLHSPSTQLLPVTSPSPSCLWLYWKKQTRSRCDKAIRQISRQMWTL